MVVGARDHDLTGFERLAQRIKYRSCEFGEFVEKQDAAMSKGNLAGAGPHAFGQIRSMPAPTAAIAAGNTPNTGLIPPCSDSSPRTNAPSTASAGTVPMATSRPSEMGGL